MSKLQQMMDTVGNIAESEEFKQFAANPRDFISARDQGEMPPTMIAQMTVGMDEVAAVLNRSFLREDEKSGQSTNVISPVVIPTGGRSTLWVIWLLVGVGLGSVGLGFPILLENLLRVDITGGLAWGLFGPHYWLLLLAYAGFSLWKNSYVMIPDGCQALITKFGKLEAVVGAGRTTLLDPWRKVSYIVNTTKEYPYNAPIREAPTAGRVNASVDLFLQFRVEDPAEFIFRLGGPQGFSEKLKNAISEVTRALIYEQKAEEIYDLVGESTQSLLDTLNGQFLPAVRFVSANITHAEPSSREYRMDLAAPEMVRVAKEAYTYEYQLKLRKEQDEGDLNKELAGMRETLSAIRAEIAMYQAQMDTAREKEMNRANALARQRLVEAESEAKANAALLEAQALDIRAVNSAMYPEILEYRFQQEVLDRLAALALHLPQVVNVGAAADQQLDFMLIARNMLGVHDGSLYTDADMQRIRERMNDIMARIQERATHIRSLIAEEQTTPGATTQEGSNGDAEATLLKN